MYLRSQPDIKQYNCKPVRNGGNSTENDMFKAKYL